MPRFRFTADPNTSVKLFCLEDSEKLKFLGLVVDESKTGFSACFVRMDDFYVGDKFSAAVGALGRMPCDVRWSQRLDDKIVKVGFQYLDE